MALRCGIDEAGRGCIAGSLFIACVILDEKYESEFSKLGIKDSKKLTQSKRDKLANDIIDFLLSVSGFSNVVCFGSDIIDSIGLKSCMQRGLLEIKSFAYKHDCYNISFDGNTSFGVDGMTTIVKGDDKDLLISAASILAKNNKDLEMIALHNMYPLYDFKHNKGYLTKKHKECIMKYGYTETHRKSYNIKSLQHGLF